VESDLAADLEPRLCNEARVMHLKKEISVE
jgi:hypothetical protein